MYIVIYGFFRCIKFGSTLVWHLVHGYPLPICKTFYLINMYVAKIFLAYVCFCHVIESIYSTRFWGFAMGYAATYC